VTRPRLFPSIDRLTEPGSTFTTTVGFFLAYASPLFFVIGVVPLFNREFVTGVSLTALGIGSWFLGHWLAGR
jgi:Na+/phosphate symporter